MAEQSFLCKNGERLGILGSTAALAEAYPSASGNYNPACHTAANRTGRYASMSAGAEVIGHMVGGVQGPIFQSNGTVVSVTTTGSYTAKSGSLVGIALVPQGGAANFTGSITTVLLSANRTYTLPDASGTIIVNGGTALAAGQVAFGDASGGITGSDTLVYTTAPLLTINANATATASLPTVITGSPLRIVGANAAANNGISEDSFGGQNDFWGRRANGTAAAPSALALDDVILSINARGYGTTGYSASGRANVRFRAAEAWTDAAQGAYTEFVTTAIGSTTAAVSGRVDNAGTLVWGGSNDGLSTYNATARTPNIQSIGTGTSTTAGSLGLGFFSATAGSSSFISYGRSKGATVGDYTAVAAGDALGSIFWEGSDGTDFARSVSIQALVDAGATVGANQVPGRVRFFTASAAGSLTQVCAMDSAQVLILGPQTVASVSTFTTGTLRPLVQQLGTTDAASTIAIMRGSNNTSGGALLLSKSRSATFGTPTVVTTGDNLGQISFQGDDGTNLVVAASVNVTATGTVGSGQIPGYMKFNTATSAGTLTQSFAVDSSQVLVVTGNTTTVGSQVFSGGTIGPKFQIQSNTSNGTTGSINAFFAATTAGTFAFGKSRSATIGTMTIVTTGDTLGNIDFQGADGTNFVAAARISGLATGTVGSGQIPGILRFSTATSAGTITVAENIDASQNHIFGNTTGTALISGGTVTPRVQVQGQNSSANASTLNVNWQNSTAAGFIYFAKSRGGFATPTVVTTGDTLGTIDWQGADGTNFISAAQISVTATGTVGAAQIPGLMAFKTATSGGTMTTAGQIDSGQNWIIAASSTSATALISGGTITPRFQVQGQNSPANASSANIHWQNAATAGFQYFAKSRGGFAVMTIVTTGDDLGTIDFQGADGTNFISSARINVTATGTVGANQIPGLMKFLTANSAGTVTEACRIDSTQVFVVGTAAASQATFTGTTITPRLQTITATAGVGSAAMMFNTTAGNGATYYFGRSKSGTVGTYTAVTTADQIGRIDAQGADGTDLASSAQINFIVDAAVAADQVPGRISMSTATTAGAITEAMRIDSAQQVVFAASAALATYTASTITPHVQVLGTTANTGAMTLTRFNGTGPARFIMAVSNGATIGTYTAITNNADLFFIDAQGSDGTDFAISSQINAQVDGTVANNQVPGRILFSTATSGGALTEAMRINANQAVLQRKGQGWGVTSTATAAGTTTLVATNTAVQIFTGSTTQTIVLPAANLLGAGIGVMYVIKNRSSGALTVNRAGADTIDGGTTTNVAAGASIILISDGVSDWTIN